MFGRNVSLIAIAWVINLACLSGAREMTDACHVYCK